MRPELDLAGIEPFPDLEVPLTRLDVSLEGAVVPERDPGVAAVFPAFVVAGFVDADTGVDAGTERVQDQEHLAPFERDTRVIAGLDKGGVGEGVAAAERYRRVPAAPGLRRAGLIRDERLAVVVMLPSRPAERLGPEVERPSVQRVQPMLDVAAAEVEVRKARGDPPPFG